ncbi:MAG: ExeM/NucH family extracellular endonuclease, partial [Actinomycetes bacterium]
LGRFGQVVVSSGGKLRPPTSVLPASDPAAVQALQAANDLNRLIVDDASQAQNPDPIVLGRGQPLSASNALRGGDRVTDVVGVLSYTWAGNEVSPNAYRLRRVGALGGTAVFDPANPRPDALPVVGTGGITVANANLLNFNTFHRLHLRDGWRTGRLPWRRTQARTSGSWPRRWCPSRS